MSPVKGLPIRPRSSISEMDGSTSVHISSRGSLPATRGTSSDFPKPGETRPQSETVITQDKASGRFRRFGLSSNRETLTSNQPKSSHDCESGSSFADNSKRISAPYASPCPPISSSAKLTELSTQGSITSSSGSSFQAPISTQHGKSQSNAIGHPEREDGKGRELPRVTVDVVKSNHARPTPLVASSSSRPPIPSISVSDDTTKPVIPKISVNSETPPIPQINDSTPPVPQIAVNGSIPPIPHIAINDTEPPTNKDSEPIPSRPLPSVSAARQKAQAQRSSTL